MIPLHYGCPDALFVQGRLDPELDAVQAAGALFGHVHCLQLPATSPVDALVWIWSQCADQLPSHDTIERLALLPLWMPLTARSPVSWADIGRRLPDAPAIDVVAFDVGDGPELHYRPIGARQARRIGLCLGAGLAGRIHC